MASVDPPLTDFDPTSPFRPISTRSSRRSSEDRKSFISRTSSFNGLVAPSVETLYCGLNSLTQEFEGIRAHSRSRRSSTVARLSRRGSPAPGPALSSCRPHKAEPRARSRSRRGSLSRGSLSMVYPTASPGQTPGYGHTSVSSHGPTPMSSHGLTPMSSHGPTSMSSHGPTSMSSHGPTPMSGHGPTPMSSHGPTPMSSHGPTPMSSHGPTPMSSHGPTPMSGHSSVTAPGHGRAPRRHTKEPTLPLLSGQPSEVELPPLRRQLSLPTVKGHAYAAASELGVARRGAESNPVHFSDPAAANAASSQKPRSMRIKIWVRKRPFHSEEMGTDCVSIQSPNIQLSITKQRVDLSEYCELNNFSFDAVFDETMTNDAIYASCGRELLEEALKGGSSSFFASGQTGSGKTHTIMGNEQEKGLYLLCATDLFRRLPPHHSVLVSFYEIYCNSLYDLLNQRFPVILREDAKGRVNICGLSWHPAATIDELWSTVNTGLELRRAAAADANERASRSHAVITLRAQDSSGVGFGGRINFVDLAGSEGPADAGSKDRRVRLEGAEINKSLLALKECIRASEERRRHIPFRGFRLTETLRDSFVGNSRIVIIANISPSSLDYEHTLSTLRYAFRVKGLTGPTLLPCRGRKAPQAGRQPASRGAPAGGRARLRSIEDRLPSLTPGAQYPKLSPAASAETRKDGMDIRDVENRIRRSVVRQLQRDISKEIHQMIGKQDLMISKLSQESKELKEIVAQRLGIEF